jgi:antitoxin component YwqK of YwqJK toxin-antitoxin module
MTFKQKTFKKLIPVLAVVCISALLWICLDRRQVPSARPVLNQTTTREMVQKYGRWYKIGETNCYTGLMVDHHPGGMLCSRSQISDGLLNGVSETWYTNGQMQAREYYKVGVSDGLREKWHENGSRMSEATIVEGKVIGTFRSWHDNGKLSEQIEMKLGRPDGVALAYYPSGYLKAQTTMNNGQMVGRKTWKDGEQSSIGIP